MNTVQSVAKELVSGLQDGTITLEGDAVPKDRLAIIPVTRELLAHVLDLPDGAEVVGLSTETSTGDLLVKVRHEQLPEVEPGQAVPVRCPRYRKSRSHRGVEFVGW